MDDEYEPLAEARVFPRVEMEVKVGLHLLADPTEEASGLLTEVSLAGCRVRTSRRLNKRDKVDLFPLTNLDVNQLRHARLPFSVVWFEECLAANDQPKYTVGLHYLGLARDMLTSWLGRLLLRSHSTEDLLLQKRRYRRVTPPNQGMRHWTIVLSHDHSRHSVELLDIAPGGALILAPVPLPVGLHLQLMPESCDLRMSLLEGAIIDCHSQDGGHFARLTFDPDSNVSPEILVRWADLSRGE